MNRFMNWHNRNTVPQRGRINRNWINFLFAHPLFLRASLSMMRRFAVLFNYRIPSQAHTQMWDVYDVVVKKKTRHFLLTRTSMCGLLVCRLIGFRSMNHDRHRHLAQCVVTPFRFIGKTKNEAKTLFQEGKRMLSECRYRATKMLEMAALLMHGESHAVLSSILSSRLSFKYAVQGERIGCPHSKGELALCYIHGSYVIKDEAKGLTLAQESAKTGSSYGQFALAMCYINGIGIAQNHADATHLLHLSAAQGHVIAQFELGKLYHHGRGIAQNDAEAVKWYSLAAKQDYFHAKYALRCMIRDGRGGA